MWYEGLDRQPNMWRRERLLCAGLHGHSRLHWHVRSESRRMQHERCDLRRREDIHNRYARTQRGLWLLVCEHILDRYSLMRQQRSGFHRKQRNGTTEHIQPVLIRIFSGRCILHDFLVYLYLIGGLFNYPFFPGKKTTWMICRTLNRRLWRCLQ